MTDRDRSPETGVPARVLTGRALVALLLAALLFLGASCGDDPTPDKEKSVVDEAVERLEAAGANVEDIYAAREWMLAKAAELPADGFEAGALARRAEDASRELVEDFSAIASSLDSRQAGTARKLIGWAEGVIAKEEARPAETRGSLATSIEPHVRSLYRIVLTAEPNNDDLRLKVGYTEHVTDLAAYLELEYLDEDRDIKKINELIEKVGDALETSPSGKKWLPPNFDMAEYEAVKSLVAERKAEFEERLKDPFQAAAHREFQEITRYLKEGKKLDGYQWVGRTHKPYLFVVERDSAWDETDVAEKKFKQLEELITLFHGEYDEVFKLEPIEKPLPLIIFKRPSAYREYAVGATLAGALGHYEHGTGRIVLSDGVGRDTMFHEGTHQLVTFHTKIDTISNFLTRSYWFQEGVAEYFGGTSAYTDPETKELRFELGMLQIGRLNYWRGNENDAYSLWDLMGLTFADRQANLASGRQDKNLMVYSQGWFLTYFLYNFRVDAENVVQIDEKPQGKYKEGFLNYFKGELEGSTGRNELLKCLGMWKDGAVDQAKFDQMEKEFTAYYNWVNRKSAMKYHVKDRKLIPWDQVENRGRKIGEKLDDTLDYEDD